MCWYWGMHILDKENILGKMDHTEQHDSRISKDFLLKRESNTGKQNHSLW